jgi:hypothetical protein
LEDRNFRKNKMLHIFESWRNIRVDKRRHIEKLISLMAKSAH